MLPWPHGLRGSQADIFATCKCAKTIRDQPVDRPVSATNHIAGAGRGDLCRVSCATAEKASALGGGNDFGSGLARTVEIAPAKRIDLAIGVGPLAVIINFVCRDDHDGSNCRAISGGL